MFELEYHSSTESSVTGDPMRKLLSRCPYQVKRPHMAEDNTANIVGKANTITLPVN